MQVDQVNYISGDAEINVRKGKQILFYELEAGLTVTAIGQYDVAEATFKVCDINSYEPDFTI